MPEKGRGEGQEESLDILDAFHTWQVKHIHDLKQEPGWQRIPPLYVC